MNKEFAVIIKMGRDVSRLSVLFDTYEDAKDAADEYNRDPDRIPRERATPSHFRNCHGGRGCKGGCR